jgi:mannose/fructose/N-acetylgalactosamine-specific phosphotransferase system component IIB
MRACKYSDKESSNATKKMVVRRAWKAALKKKKKSPPLSNLYKKLAVAKWREIHTSNTPPSALVEWTEEDKADLKRIAETEIDMTDTYLGRYAAMQKKNAVAAVLDFTDKERESLKQLNEDNMMRRMTNSSEEGNNNNNCAGLGAKNGVNGGEINEEAV